jgi:outer membrane receptor protein involved in Fe transport
MGYICGAVPELGSAISATGGYNIIDTPTSLRTSQAAAVGSPNFLIDNLVNAPNPAAVSSAPAIDHIGLARNVFRASLSAEYALPADYTLVFQGGYNRLRASWIRPFGLTPLGFWWSKDPTDSKDKSYELRVTSPQESRFTWLAGINYYEQDFIQSGSGGTAIALCWPKTAPMGAPAIPVRAPGGPCIAANVQAQLFPNTLAQNSDHVETTGLFAAVSYKLTDAWTASLEGRQQKDAATSGTQTTTPREIVEKKFLPRAILRWQPSRSTNVYASFSKGILPPQVNTQLAIATPRELAQYQAAQPGVATIIPGDQLKMYELGWKQLFLDNRASLSVAIYKGDWTNQKGRSVAAIQEDCGSPSHPTSAATLTECPLGATGLPAVFPNGQPFPNFRNFNVAGSTTLSGIELQGAFAITDRWEVQPTFTYAKTEYKDFIFNFLSPISQFTQMKGNQNARFPKSSGSLASSYHAPFTGDWKWFLNGDVSYVGKTFTDESNLAYCKSYFLANARVGFEKSDLRIEGFVKNLTNDRSYSACARWSDFDSAPTVGTAWQGVAVTPLVPRQIGIRASIKF